MTWISKKGEALRDLVESQGGKGAHEIIKKELKEGTIKPSDFSLQEIWAATERDKDGRVRSIKEAVSSDQFPTITGEIISSTLISAYDNTQIIGDQLAETVSSKMETEVYAGFNGSENPELVLQGEEYKRRDLTEKWTSVRHEKYGTMLEITEEALFYDRTGQILMRAAGIGEKAKLYKEKQIVEGVQDVNSNVYKPSGIATAFYRTAASGDRKINSASSNPFGEAGIDAGLKLMHNMIDENGDPILINQSNLIGLFPQDLEREAKQMVRSTLVPEGTENAENIYKGLFKVLTSYFVTAQSASTWYIGEFNKDFKWSEVWPLSTSTRADSQMRFDRDIIMQLKVRYLGAITAIDDKHSYKFTA